MVEPSNSQVMSGRGLPSAMQVNSAWLLRWTEMLVGGWRMEGGSGEMGREGGGGEGRGGEKGSGKGGSREEGEGRGEGGGKERGR